MPRRRPLLAALPALLLPRFAAAGAARLRPGQTSAIALAPLPQERVAFHASGLDGAIVLPAARARLIGLLPLPDRDAALLAFAADSPQAAADLLAVVVWDGAGLRIAALDVLAWQSGDGAHLATRPAWHGALILARTAAAPRGGLMWRRESWTDYLAWQGAGAFIDRPARPPAPQTWQHSLGIWRSAALARLAAGCRDATVLGEAPDFRAG